MQELQEQLEKKEYKQLALNELNKVNKQVYWKKTYLDLLTDEEKWFERLDVIQPFIKFFEEINKTGSNISVFKYGISSSTNRDIDDKRRFICIPFGNDYHFVLVVWDQKNQTLTVYDSFKKANKQLAKNAIENFCTKIRSVENKFTNFNKRSLDINTKPIGVQTDGYSCGPFIILFMVCLQKENKITEEKVKLVNIRKFRSYVLYICINYLKLQQIEKNKTQPQKITTTERASITDIVDFTSKTTQSKEPITVDSSSDDEDNQSAKEPITVVSSSDDEDDLSKEPSNQSAKKQKIGASFTKLMI